MAAFAWIVEHVGEFGGDPGRIGLVGHSAGAYNAMMLAIDPRRLKALGLRRNLRAVAGIAGPYDFYPFDAPISLRTFGAVRQGSRTQPIHYVDANAPPALLVTGERDRLVHPRNTTAMAMALEAAGVPVVERHYPRLGHAITVLALAQLVRRVGPVLDDVAGFFAWHLQGRLEASPAETQRPAASHGA
jgi:acetyl esterase/lipase